jgi:hypothetical protein
MVEAKLSMAFSEDADDRLPGLVPRPQGFHKKCIILQDFMNMLFSGSTVGEKGFLYHIKSKFTFCSVKKNPLIVLIQLWTSSILLLGLCLYYYLQTTRYQQHRLVFHYFT